MENLINTLNKSETLSTDELFAIEQLRPLAKYRRLKKGEFLFSAGDIIDISIYVDSGLLRKFVCDANGNEKIVQFLPEESFFDDCSSLSNNKPIEYSMQALEDCEITWFYLADMVDVAKDFPAFEKTGMKIMNAYLASAQEHVTILMKYNPEGRYKYLLEHNPALIQRVSVTHLAQYLDMSRETLSRMRAKIAEPSIL